MKLFDADKTRMIGLPCGKKNCDNMLSRFHLISERHGQTDRVVQTYGQNCYINIARQQGSFATKRSMGTPVSKRPSRVSAKFFFAYFLCYSR